MQSVYLQRIMKKNADMGYEKTKPKQTQFPQSTNDVLCVPSATESGKNSSGALISLVSVIYRTIDDACDGKNQPTRRAKPKNAQGPNRARRV